MLKKYFLLLLVLLPIEFLFQQDKEKFEFLPTGLNFLPLRANMDEAKVGVLYYPDNGNLKVDIGNTMDLFAYHFSENKKITAGIEFMAYASVIGYEQQRLQIDAVDGFFGGNISYSNILNENKFQLRFRFIHNSAHLVDGNWWVSKYPRTWTKPGGPIPFTTDFSELIAANNVSLSIYSMRYYGGIQYAVMVRPNEIKKLSASCGFELHSEKIIDNVFSNPVNLFFAYHFNAAGYPKYTGTSHLQTGIKFGCWNSKGILFYLSYFSGNNMFSEYYNERITKFGIGFAVDFP